MTSIVLTGGSESFAQENEQSSNKGSASIRVSPAIVDLRSGSSAAIEKSIQITNINNTPVGINVTKDRLSDPNTSQQAPDSANGCEWVNPKKNSHIFQPQESASFEFFIRIPENAPPGGSYCLVKFETRPLDATVSNGETQINAVVGVPFLFSVNGDVKRSAQFEGLPISSRFLFSSGPQILKINVKNTGNVHLTVSGKTRIKNLVTRSENNIDFLGGIVLPENQRKFESTWLVSAIPGVYEITSELNQVNSDGQMVKSKTVKLIVFPVSFIVICIALGVGLLVVWKIIKRARRRRAAIHQESNGSSAVENSSFGLTETMSTNNEGQS